MRIAAVSFLALVAIATPAVANSCYWINGYAYCDVGCWLTDRWWDGSREWMQWTCGPPPEVMFAGAVVALMIVIVGIIRAITSAASSNSRAADIQQIEHFIPEDDDIKHDMENAMHRADAHIAAMLEKYRKGDDHG